MNCIEVLFSKFSDSRGLELFQSNPDFFRTQKEFPVEICRGKVESVCLEDGLSFTHCKCSDIINETRIQTNLIEHQAIMIFHLTHDIGVVETERLKKQIFLNPGDSYILGPDKTVILKLLPGRIANEFSLFANESLLKSILSGKKNGYPEVQHPDFENLSNPQYALSGRTTPKMKLCIQQILHSQLEGPPGRFYIKAKLLELIALRLDQANNQESSSYPYIISEKDLKALETAQRILHDQLKDPPSITELARKSRINPTKLKKLFKRHFGTTPFRYLRSERMEKALHLIREGICNISETAELVGYSSKSSFTKAFTSEYGVQPGIFKRTQSLKVVSD